MEMYNEGEIEIYETKNEGNILQNAYGENSVEYVNEDNSGEDCDIAIEGDVTNSTEIE